jgi:hypothetical protein
VKRGPEFKPRAVLFSGPEKQSLDQPPNGEISMTRTMPWGPAELAPPLSATLLNLLAALLRAASDLLARRATRLAEAAQADAQAAAEELLSASAQMVEFHALHRDAGAPEGALYVNGRLVGTISGVTRL